MSKALCLDFPVDSNCMHHLFSLEESCFRYICHLFSINNKAGAAYSIFFGVYQKWLSLGLEIRCLLCNFQVCFLFIKKLEFTHYLCTVEQTLLCQHTETRVMHLIILQLEVSVTMLCIHYSSTYVVMISTYFYQLYYIIFSSKSIAAVHVFSRV